MILGPPKFKAGKRVIDIPEAYPARAHEDLREAGG
jgi:hypothetical protein